MERKSIGFTLIELLVVIAIIATILTLAVPNFLGVRQRARDAKKKAELHELKTALRMYYNDFQQYPAENISMANKYRFYGCGASGVSLCPDAFCSSYEFSAGGTNCTDTTTYMKRLPRLNANGTVGGYNYYRVNADEYCMYTTLDNAGDQEITASQSRCSAYCAGTCTSGTARYCACPD